MIEAYPADRLYPKVAIIRDGIGYRLRLIPNILDHIWDLEPSYLAWGGSWHPHKPSLRTCKSCLKALEELKPWLLESRL